MLCLGDVQIGEGCALVIATSGFSCQLSHPPHKLHPHNRPTGVLLRFRTSWPLLPQPATNTSVSGSTWLIVFSGDKKEEKELGAARASRWEQKVVLPKSPSDVVVVCFFFEFLGTGTVFVAAEGSSPWAVPD